MTEPRTPTTAEVRTSYGWVDGYPYEDYLSPEGVAEFDRWLADMKAEVWDEGRKAAEDSAINADGFDDCPNPYREVGNLSTRGGV